jgi:putative alpha-1,2-mannosidase
MYSLLYPNKMSSIVESFIDRASKNKAEQNGIVLGDEYMAANEYLAGQGGNDIDNAITDAYLKGVKLNKYTWYDAYSVLLSSAERMRSKEYVENGFATGNAKTVTGKSYTWRFKSAAATMGFAFNDKAIATVAKELGTEEEHNKYLARSANWLNVWNPRLESEGFFGFPQNPNTDGSFEEGFDAHGGYNSHFYEATGWDA